MTACDKFDGDVDAGDVFFPNRSTLMVRLLEFWRESITRPLSFVDDDTEDVNWLDLGEDSSEELNRDLDLMLVEAANYGLDKNKSGTT